MSTTTPSPAEKAKADLNMLRSRWGGISSRSSLNSLASEIQNLGNSITSLETEIKDLRQRGYVFGNGWEEKAAALLKSWPGQRSAAERAITLQVNALKGSAREVDQVMTRAATNPLLLLPEAERKVEGFENEIQRIETLVRGNFSLAEDQESDLSQALEAARFAIDALEDASFKLNPNENVYMVCKAEWLVDRENPDGFFYLTDQRVIFEQSEEIATQKVLFIATKKEKVRKLRWGIPVGAVAEIKSEDKGGFIGIGAKELLHLRFAEAPHDVPLNVTVHVQDGATNDVWSKAIRLVQSGEIERERAGAETAGAPAAAAGPQTVSAPTVCPACNGQLPMAYKGMTQLKCEYCGTAVPIG